MPYVGHYVRQQTSASPTMGLEKGNSQAHHSQLFPFTFSTADP